MSQLMLFWEIVTVSSESLTKPMNTLRRNSAVQRVYNNRLEMFLNWNMAIWGLAVQHANTTYKLYFILE